MPFTLRASAAFLAAVLACSQLAACTGPKSTGPGAPAPSPTAQAAPTEPASVTIGDVIEATHGVVGALLERRGVEATFPVTLNVADGRVAGVPVPGGVEVAEYEVTSANGDPQFRVCLRVPKGPWVGYDSATALEVTGLAGQCAFTPDPGETSAPTDFSDADVHDLDPTTTTELAVVLTREATLLADALTDVPTRKRPANLQELTESRLVADLNEHVRLSGYEVTTHPDGFTVCVTGDVGGWARYDSAEPEQVNFGFEGDCRVAS